MNHDVVLVNIMKRQADAFNRDAPEWERVALFMEVQQYQKNRKVNDGMSS